MKMIEPWVLYAFIGLIGYFFVNLLLKYVSSENLFLVSLVVYGSAAISMLVVIGPRMEFSLGARSIVLAVLIGICSVTATIFAAKSMRTAPNPGYSATIYSANFVLLAIVSMFLFGSPFSFIKFLGILATLVGLVLLSI